MVPSESLDIATPRFSLFAYSAMQEALNKLGSARIVLPNDLGDGLGLLGTDLDRSFRNQLNIRWLSNACAAWVDTKVGARQAPGEFPQAVLVTRGGDQSPRDVISGDCSFTTSGLGLTPGNRFGLVQASANAEECATLAAWFDALWTRLSESANAKTELLAVLRNLGALRDPSQVFHAFLYHIFKDRGEDLDEDRIIKSATGIRGTMVWKKLYKFQRDGVLGAIDKLNRFGGCIIADSVGFGQDV